MTNYNRIIIIEPDTSIINTFNQIEYADEILNNKRIVLCSCDESVVNSAFLSFISDYNIANTNVVVYSNYDRIYEREYTGFMKGFLKYSERCIFNMNTQIVFSTHLVNQFLKILKILKIVLL
jgi:hypothetical protein